MSDLLPEIDVTTAAARMAVGEPLLDVREQHEWDAGHVLGAIHIPMSELIDRVAELPSGPMMVICHVGGRSARVTDWLLRQGHEATNVAWGMDGWENAGLPVERTRGF